MGLVAPDPPLRFANPVYGEVVPRELTWVLQDRIPDPAAWYVRPDGGLDMDGLLAAFQDFFRQNSEHWIRRAQYTEAGPQLVLQAFLHRVVNATGRIEREYALGSRRVDLLVVWPRERGAEDRIVVECKLVKEGPLPLAHGRRRTRTDCALHGHQRHGRGPSRGIRHAPGQELGGEGLPGETGT